VLLQRLAELGELFRPGTGDTCLGKEVLLDSIGTFMTSITFHAHLPKHGHPLGYGTSPGHKSFLPCGDGSLSQARSYLCSSMATTCEGDGTLHQSTSRSPRQDKESRPRQTPEQSKSSPGQRRCPARRGDVYPCSIGRWLAVIMVEVPAVGTFAMVSPTSHHGQRSRASFKVGGEER
jgi:hypothetical protein